MASRGCGTFGPAGAFSPNQAHQLYPTGTHPNIQNIMLVWLHLKRSPMLFSSGQMVLNKNTVELVLLGQRQWEDGGVGKACVNQCVDQQLLRRQTQSLIRGIVNAPSRRARGPTSPPGLSSCVSPLCVQFVSSLCGVRGQRRCRAVLTSEGRFLPLGHPLSSAACPRTI